MSKIRVLVLDGDATTIFSCNGIPGYRLTIDEIYAELDALYDLKRLPPQLTYCATHRSSQWLKWLRETGLYKAQLSLVANKIREAPEKFGEYKGIVNVDSLFYLRPFDYYEKFEGSLKALFENESSERVVQELIKEKDTEYANLLKTPESAALFHKNHHLSLIAKLTSRAYPKDEVEIIFCDDDASGKIFQALENIDLPNNVKLIAHKVEVKLGDYSGGFSQDTLVEYGLQPARYFRSVSAPGFESSSDSDEEDAGFTAWATAREQSSAGSSSSMSGRNPSRFTFARVVSDLSDEETSEETERCDSDRTEDGDATAEMCSSHSYSSFGSLC